MSDRLAHGAEGRGATQGSALPRGLAELVREREALHGPYWRARLMRALRGPKHGLGDKGGLWGIGKPLLRLTSRWPLRLIRMIGVKGD